MSDKRKPSAEKKERSAWWVKARAELPGKIKHWFRQNFGMTRKTVLTLLRRGVTFQTRSGILLLILCTALTDSGTLRGAFGAGLFALAAPVLIQLAVAFLCKIDRIRALAARYHVAAHTPGYALMGGLGTGLGCAAALCVLGGVREVVGSGTLAGSALFGAAFPPVLAVALPCGGLILLGALLALLQWLSGRNRKKGGDAA